jgi:hypothetical protein
LHGSDDHCFDVGRGVLGRRPNDSLDSLPEPVEWETELVQRSGHCQTDGAVDERTAGVGTERIT